MTAKVKELEAQQVQRALTSTTSRTGTRSPEYRTAIDVTPTGNLESDRHTEPPSSSARKAKAGAKAQHEGEGLTAAQLADRLAVANPTLKRSSLRSKINQIGVKDSFAQWSQERDPEGKAWERRGDRYYAIPDNKHGIPPSNAEA